MLKKIYGLYDRMGGFYGESFIIEDDNEFGEELAKRDFILFVERFTSSDVVTAYAFDLELRLIGDFNVKNGYLKSYDENLIVMTGKQALDFIDSAKKRNDVEQMSFLDYEGKE